MQSIFPNLDKQLRDRGMDYTDLGRAIGIKDLSMYRRMKGISNFQLPEVVAICQYFQEPNAVDLFTIR